MDPRIGKCRDAVAGSGYVPNAILLLHADEQQQTVPIVAVAVAVIIVEVVGIGGGISAVQRFRGHDNDIHLLTHADLLKLFAQLRLLYVGQQIGAVHDPILLITRKTGGTLSEGRNRHTQAEHKNKQNRPYFLFHSVPSLK